MLPNPHLVQLQKDINPLREKLIHHPVYSAIQNMQHLRIFMQYHVFAVWDFMSLLKVLQINLTCVSIPWMPVGNPETRALINEIVAGEESDIDLQGNQLSHFEMYLEAMDQAGASMENITQFSAFIHQKIAVADALLQAQVPAAVQEFVNYTFSLIAQSHTHLQAAAFTFGREDLIPGMFISFVEELNRKPDTDISKFTYYLQRHIEVDGDHHSHLAHQMVAQLCGNDIDKWQAATQVAQAALQARLKLWDAIAYEISQN